MPNKDTFSPVERFAAQSGTLEEKLFSQVALIRRFEERLLELFEEGLLFGTTHAYIGQEANAVGIINHLNEKDVLFSNHRCHGHFITYCDQPELMMGELMGKETGVVGGRGGSQHVCVGNFHTNGIQGGILPNSVGMGLSEKLSNTGGIAVVFIGDGTLGEGVGYEALNMASLWDVPILVVVENNRWAQSTPTHLELAGSMVKRGEAFGIDSGEIDSTDAVELYEHFGPIIEKIRKTGRPHFEVVHTYRLCHHSKSDDMRPKDEVERYRSGDPLPKLKAKLDEAAATRITAEANKRIEECEAWCKAQPFPDPASMEDALDVPAPEAPVPSLDVTPTNVVSSINAALRKALETNDRVLVMGEDLLDPYGGAFKAMKGISTAFPDRVIPTPIAEAGFTGIACGLAMRGHRPIVEMMFGDFTMLAADQILNHIAKYRWMYNKKVSMPLVIRAPMGGGRGYGPTHSQSIEKHFLGVPGLVIVSPTPYHDPGQLLLQAVLGDDRPVLFVENKLMYSRSVRRYDAAGQTGDLFMRKTSGPYPTVSLSYTEFEEADITIVTYGGMAETAEKAAEHLLMEHEIVCEIVLPSALNPLDIDPIADSLSRSGRLMFVEEGTETHGVGAEVVRRVTTERFDALRAAPITVAARNCPIANTRSLEDAILPQLEDIVRAGKKLAGARLRAVSR